jgi:hypothetical protein
MWYSGRAVQRNKKKKKIAENNHRFRYYHGALVFFSSLVDSYYTYCSADDFGEETSCSYAEHRTYPQTSITNENNIIRPASVLRVLRLQHDTCLLLFVPDVCRFVPNMIPYDIIYRLLLITHFPCR